MLFFVAFTSELKWSVKKDCCARKHANFNLGQILHTGKVSKTLGFGKLKTMLMMMMKIINLLYVAARYVNACTLSNA